MKVAAIYKICQMAYANILRSLLVKAIEDPSTEWDDVVLRMLDGMFDYKGQG